MPKEVILFITLRDSPEFVGTLAEPPELQVQPHWYCTKQLTQEKVQT